MKLYASSWQAARKLTLRFHGWEPEKRPRAVVALVPGLGDHVLRYGRVAEFLVRSGCAFVGFDLRGHGTSDGPRGDTPGYQVLMDDIADFLAQVRSRYGRVPVFLFGHSLGGNLVLNFALRRKPALRGVIATSPWLQLVQEPTSGTLTLARALSLLVPGFTANSGLEAGAMSRDPAAVDAYMNDPLVHDRISPRLFLAARESGGWALEHAADFRLPLLLMHGTSDRITSCAASREFVRRAGRRLVTWKSWDGWYHELHNDPDSTRMLAFMLRWMNRQLAQGPRRKKHAGQKRPRVRKSAALRSRQS